MHAADVDSKARFPTETVAALREAGLLGAAVPRELGGPGCGMLELGQLCATLAQACGSSAMVLAMHYSQLACLARHGLDSEFFRNYLRDMVEHPRLLASMTSEVGTYGDTRSSICAVERQAGRFRLGKDATTGSYCAHADAILVTCRRDADAGASDQLLVLVRREDCTLAPTTSWDTLGMRGTCSPGFRLESSGAQEQIVPGSFADSSAQTMVPYSHILWSSLWWGIAADAVAKASVFVRGQARQTPGTVPPTATRLAEVSLLLQNMKQNWQSAAQAFDAHRAGRAGRGTVEHRLGAAAQQSQDLVFRGRAPDRASRLADRGHHGLQERQSVQPGAPLPRRAVGFADDFQRPHRRQERIDAACLQGLRLSPAYDIDDFNAALVEHGLIVPTAVKGTYGRGPVFEDIAAAFQRPRQPHRDTRRRAGAELPAGPGALADREGGLPGQLPAAGRLGAQLFRQRRSRPRAVGAGCMAGERWEEMLAPTDVMLTPAACYPVYPTFSGLLPDGGRLVSVLGWVFRHEPSDEPTRLQAFRMREFIRVGRPDDVVAWRDAWLQRGLDLLLGLGLPATSDVASDPFFGRAGKMLAASQVDQRLKFEILVPVISLDKPTAICSFNWHQDHFSSVFGIRNADESVAHTACLGFGLERVTLALVKTHGFDPARWPDAVRSPALAMSRYEVLPGLDAARYQRHPLHGEDAIWAEKNCYGDMWIELLHALKLEPLASLPYTLAVDFEGDQWTFFKPPLDELRDLYGIDVQELTVWRPLLEHAVEHLGAGKLISTEADAFWLPDTAGTDYRQPAHQDHHRAGRPGCRGRAAGLFPQRRLLRTRGRGFPRAVPPGPARGPCVHALVRRAGAHRPRGRGARRPNWRPAPCACCASTSTGGLRPIRSCASVERFAQDLPQLREAGLRPLPRLGLRLGAAGGRGLRTGGGPSALARGVRHVGPAALGANCSTPSRRATRR